MKNEKDKYMIDRKVDKFKIKFPPIKKWNSIKSCAEKLNIIYNKEDFRINYLNKYMYLEIDEEERRKICNFFIIPSHEIYIFDGVEEKYWGMRLKVYIATGVSEIQCTKLNLTDKLIEKDNWINEYLSKDHIVYKKEDYQYIRQAIKLSSRLFKDKNKVKIYADCIGWVKGKKEWHYIPNTKPNNEKDIYFNNKAYSKFIMKADENIDNKTAFIEVFKMLDISDKRITIPLISYTLFTCMISIIKSKNISLYPKFIINLIGTNKNIKKEALANLFCNSYNRNTRINAINSEYHTSLKCSYKIINEKMRIMRDSVLIINDFCNRERDYSEKVDMLINILEDKNICCGLLGVGDSSINNDKILMLDVTDININLELLKEYKQKATVFSTFICKYLNLLKKRIEGLNIEVLIEKTREDFIVESEEDDLDKLTIIEWLYMSYRFFIDFAVYVGAIDAISGEEKIKETLEIFKKLSAPKSNISEEHILADAKCNAKLFLQAVKEIINTHTLIKIGKEPTDNDNVIGWYDEKALYLKYKEIWTSINFNLDTNNTLVGGWEKINECLSKEEVIEVQYENKGKTNQRVRYDCNKTVFSKNKKRVLIINKEKMEKFLLSNDEVQGAKI